MRQLNTMSSRKNNTFKTLEARFKHKHNDTYTYEKAIFDGMMTHLTITCKVHGHFNQIPAKHVNGQGCPTCGVVVTASKKTRYTKEEMEKVAKGYTTLKEFRDDNPTIYRQSYKRFGKEFRDGICAHMINPCKPGTTLSFQEELDDDYVLLSEYVNALTKVTLKHSKCSTVYGTKPNSYRNGSRCPTCAVTGFKKELSAILYYCSITLPNSKKLYKIGITNNTLNYRYTKYEKVLMSDVYYIHGTGHEMYKLEQELLQENSTYKYDGKDVLRTGNTELLTKDILNTIKDKCEDIGKTIQKDENWKYTDM